MRAYEKVKKAMSKKNKDLAEQLLTRKPSYTLDMLIKERYPKFIDAPRDLDDCLSMVHLFAALPAVDRVVDGEKIPVDSVHNCRRLSHEWQAYISRTHRLQKTFISVKGIYYQAEVEGQKITWLTPHALQQVLPEVDYRVLLTFFEFYEIVKLEKQYHDELRLELQGVPYSAVSNEVEGEDAEGETASDIVDQIAADEDNMSKMFMSHNKIKLYEAMKMSDGKKGDDKRRLKEREKWIKAKNSE